MKHKFNNRKGRFTKLGNHSEEGLTVFRTPMICVETICVESYAKLSSSGQVSSIITVSDQTGNVSKGF